MTIAQPAELFDGKSAASHLVTVEVHPDSLLITGSEGAPRRWSFAGLEAVVPAQHGQALRLKHSSEPNSRLHIPASLATEQILAEARHLTRSFHPGKALRFSLYMAAGIALLIGTAYAILNLAPQRIAAMMPIEWRENLADHTERIFLKDAKQCTSDSGRAALAAMASRVAAASGDAPDFSVRVFDMPFINAFALPGGRVVLTGRLIKEADSAEEVAGVIAHELGHTAHLHPEASLVRNIGLQVLISLATGGSGGDTLGDIAGVLAVLQYSRNAEREADDYAVDIMTKGDIDPKGLRHFFEKLNKKEWSIVKGRWKDLSNMLSTHPGTKERIEFIKPLPPGQARDVITPQQWEDLRKICS